MDVLSRRGRRISSSESDSDDFEIIPSPANFLPEEPGSEYSVDDVREKMRKIREATSTIKFVVLKFLIILAVAGFLAAILAINERNNMHVERINQKINKYVSALVNVNLKLKQQNTEIQRENARLKAQLADLLRWREAQEEKLQLAIEKALEKYDEDKIGLIDFALSSAGGYVIATPNTVPYQINESRFIGLINMKEHSDPQLLLKPGVLPGQCFAFEGRKGRIQIHLARKINITNVTLEHVPRNLVDDNGRTAPKEFVVIVIEFMGLKGDMDKNGEVLGSFIYKIDGKPLQTFQVPNFNENPRYDLVELRVLSNYGHEEYTCVYRFRVHGIPE